MQSFETFSYNLKIYDPLEREIGYIDEDEYDEPTFVNKATSQKDFLKELSDCDWLNA